MTYSARILALLGFVFSLSSPILAQQPADEDVRQFTVRTVGADSKPIPGVKLWISADYPQFPVYVPGAPRGRANTTTDNAGVAVFDIPASQVNVMATADGYAPLFIRGVDLTRQPVTDIRLGTGHAITGQIFTAEGAPVTGARVIARRKNFDLSYMDEFTPTAVTDFDGKFNIPQAADGSYVLSVLAPTEMASLSFDPITVDVADAAPAAAKMIAKAGIILKGRFITPAGMEAGGKRLTVLIRLPQEVRWEVTTEPDGSFTIANIPSGARGFVAFPSARSYSTVITPPANQTMLLARNESLELVAPSAGTYGGIEARLLKPVQVTGKVTDDAGKALSNVEVVIEPTNRIYRSDASGIYTGELPPGAKGGLRILQSNGYFSAPAVPLPVGQEGQTIEQNLIAKVKPVRPHDGEISGKVIDASGKPVAGARVFLGNEAVIDDDLTRPTRDTTTRPTWTGGTVSPAQVTTDAQGNFRFNMLDAGKTDVWVHHPTGWACSLDVSYKTSDLTLTLAPAQERITIAGTVLDAVGRGAGGVKLYLFTGGGGVVAELLTQATSNADGKYSITVNAPQDRASIKFFRLVAVGEQGITWRNLPQWSVPDVPLSFRPSATMTGRVVDPDGRPLSGARVRAGQFSHPELGKLNLWAQFAIASTWFPTDQSGTYQMKGVPVGSTIFVRARHPDFGGSESMFVNELQAQTSAADAKMERAVILDGIVRHLETRQPIQGATVSISGTDRDGEPIKAITNAEGRYRLSGLDRMTFLDSLTVLQASVGQPPELGGQVRYTSRLTSGDQVSIDLFVQRSLESREAEWRAQRGKPLDSKSLIAVMDDADPAVSEKQEYHDTLTIYDAQGQVSGQYNGLHIASTGGGGHPIGWSPADGTLWLIENMGKRFLNFSRDGKLVAEHKDAGIVCFTFDPKNGNIWTLGGGTRLGTSTIRVFNPQFQQIATYPTAGWDIAYSPHDDCFWVVGMELKKIARDGTVLATGAIRFIDSASCLAVNGKDGSVWVTERQHPQRPGTFDRLTIFDPNGQVRKQIEGPDVAVTVDSERGIAWALARFSQWPQTASFNADGTPRAIIPVKGFSVSVEPDTGYAWLASDSGIDRIDLDGKPVSSISNSGKTQKWIAATGSR